MILQIPRSDGTVAAVFRLSTQIWADTIYLVGDFNNWSTNATPMRRGEQYWEATVTLPAGSTAYYAYLLDGSDWCSEYCGESRQGDVLQAPLELIPIEVLNARSRAVSRL